MKYKTKEQTEDYKRYYNYNPDPDYNPAQQKALIEESIRKGDKNRERIMSAWTTRFRQSANMLSDYVFSPKSKTMNMERYFGPRWIGYLRGAEIVGELQGLNKRSFYT